MYKHRVYPLRREVWNFKSQSNKHEEICCVYRHKKPLIEICYIFIAIKSFYMTMLKQTAISKKQPESVNMFNLINLGSSMIVIKKYYDINNYESPQSTNRYADKDTLNRYV